MEEMNFSKADLSKLDFKHNDTVIDIGDIKDKNGLKQIKKRDIAHLRSLQKIKKQKMLTRLNLVHTEAIKQKNNIKIDINKIDNKILFDRLKKLLLVYYRNRNKAYFTEQYILFNKFITHTAQTNQIDLTRLQAFLLAIDLSGNPYYDYFKKWVTNVHLA